MQLRIIELKATFLRFYAAGVLDASQNEEITQDEKVSEPEADSIVQC